MKPNHRKESKLIGAGIICGLEVNRTDDCAVVVHPGYGLTSNGTWLEQSTLTEYIYYRKLNPKAESDLFDYFQAEEMTAIYELLQTHQCGPETPEYSWIPKQSKNDQEFLDLNDKIVVLYVEEDNASPRTLAFHREDLAAFLYGDLNWQKILLNKVPDGDHFSLWPSKVQEKPAIYINEYALYNHLHPLMKLPVLRIRRFGYASIKLEDLSCDEDYLPVFCDPEKSFDLFEEYTSLTDQAFLQLDEAICFLHEHLTSWISTEDQQLFRLQFEALSRRWEAYKKPSKAKPTTPDQSGIQYWYDLLRDLFDAWNEWREAFLQYNAVCSLDEEAFPRHLVLGALPEEQEPDYHLPFRTVFQQAPIFNKQAEQLHRLRFLYKRMGIMMKSFFVPNTDWDDTAADAYLKPLSKIGADNPSKISPKLPPRLTPSAPPHQPLGKRAIPVYYDLADHPQSLHWYWDYEATYQNRLDLHLSYHADNDPEQVKKTQGWHYAGIEADAYTNRIEAVHPFAYDLRDLPFIRVEGLVGMEIDIDDPSALTSSQLTGTQPKKEGILTKLNQKYNLCFAVKIINITPLVSSKDIFCGKCYEHLGGVFWGGTLVLAVVKKDGETAYKIVGDFTYPFPKLNP